MSLAIFAAPFNNETIHTFEENDTLHKKKMSKTLKKYPNVHSYNEDFVHKNHKDVDYNKVNQVMKAMNNLPSHNDELGEFKPLPPPISSGVQSTIRREQKVKEGMSNHNDDITPVNEYKYSSFEEEDQHIPPQIPIQEPPSYYKMPNFSEVNNSSSSSKEPLMEKINYMIHLLEEQQDEKTGNVTEEVILYSFLGIFIIFIVDSFYYVGKYTR
jgi:hypothetical protein